MSWTGRLGWLAASATVALTAALMTTQAAGWDGVTMLVPIAQVATPYLCVATTAVAVIAVLRRRLLLATLAVPVAASVLLLAMPALFPGPPDPAAPGATGMRVASVNLLYRNDRIADVADSLDAIDADVLALSEFTEAHRAGLAAAGLAERYPHRVERPRRGPTGIAVWSRYPLEAEMPPNTYTESLDVTIDGPDGPIRLLAVHLQSPIAGAATWRREHALVESIAETIDSPTLIAGDFNSGYWHPAFRRLLEAGLADAHIELGDGLSASWPAHLPVPPFVRLDHALTGGGLVATAVADMAVPGSDHRGVVVTVAPAR